MSTIRDKASVKYFVQVDIVLGWIDYVHYISAESFWFLLSLQEESILPTAFTPSVNPRDYIRRKVLITNENIDFVPVLAGFRTLQKFH